MKRALEFSAALIKSPYFPDDSKIIEWRGRVFLYLGNEKMAIKHFEEALRSDPTNEDCSDMIRAVKTSQVMKEKASKLFKEEKYEEAAAQY